MKKLTRIVRIQDYGYVAIPRDIFNRRYEDNLPLEIAREFTKHPQLGSRIAELDEQYSIIANEVLAHEEHWDGSGYPNGLSGEEIPVLSRISKIIGDYTDYIQEKPYGRGLSRTTALKHLEHGSGSIYDPVYVKHFIDFLNKDNS